MKQWFFLKQASTCLLIASLITSPVAAQKKLPTPRKQIGEVLGQPVYRDQIKAASRSRRNEKLMSLFLEPLIDAYLKKHRNRLIPTQEEFDAFIGEEEPDLKQFKVAQVPLMRAKLRQLETNLKSTNLAAKQRRNLEKEYDTLRKKTSGAGPLFYECLIAWKMQQDIYRKYGGGRIRFLTMGVEPHDAIHNWLKQEEKQGRLKIEDPQLRTEFYSYWTDGNKVGYVVKDPKEIRRDFLEPDWQKKARAETPLEAPKP